MTFAATFTSWIPGKYAAADVPCDAFWPLQGAFELIVAQCPMAVAGMLSGMGRRLAAASAIRSYGSKYDPTGRAAVATPVPAVSKQNGAAGGGSAKRGEVVTICLVPAGERQSDDHHKDSHIEA